VAPRSPYFQPPTPPPPPPPGPSFASGLRVVLISIGVLVAAAVCGLLLYDRYGQQKRDEAREKRERTSDRPDRKKEHAPKESKLLPILKTDPVRGSDHAWVTIVEFSDFQCPYCSRVQPTLAALDKKYGEKLRIVWKDNPLPFHKEAMPAARMAKVAFLEKGAQAFWRAHDTMFADQSKIATSLEKWGDEVGADSDAFSRHGKDAEEQIDESIRFAKQIGATGTPMFFIDGEKLSGAQPQSKFEDVIDAHLREAKKLVDAGTDEVDLYADLVERYFEEPAPSFVGLLYAVDATGAASYGAADSLVTIVVFAPLSQRYGSDKFELADLIKLPDTRVVFRDRPVTSDERAAAGVVRAIGDKSGAAKRRDAIDEIWSSTSTVDTTYLKALATRYGLTTADATKAIADSATDRTIDDDIDAGDEVDATTSGVSVYVNGRKLTSITKTDVITAHAAARKHAERLVTGGIAAKDVYKEITSKGTRKARKHATIPIPTTSPTRGPSTAAVTIQVFSDFQCPFCARAMTGDFDKVVAAHPTDVRVVYRNMPLTFHPMAEPAAQMALEAKAQRGVPGFWRVHDAIYRAKAPLDATKLDAIATAEGLDLTKVHDAMKTHKYKSLIDDDVKAASSAGISGTPTFLVGDEIVNGAVPAATFESAITRAKARLKSP